jgi:hypothetical protein
MTSRSEYLLLLLLALVACRKPQIIEEPNEDPSPTDIVGEGTIASPYSVSDAQMVKVADDVWIQGYIVGAVSGSIGAGCVWSVPTSISANILLSDDTIARDSRRVLPVQLTTNKKIRSRLNLEDNPELLHQFIIVRGRLDTYYSVPGIRDITVYRFDDGEDINGEITADNEWEGFIQ